MKVDLYKVGKSLLKYYLIYHIVFDLYILGQFVYPKIRKQSQWQSQLQ